VTGVSGAAVPGLACDLGGGGERLQAIAAGLRAAGLTVRVQQTRAGWDLTGVLERAGGRASEVVVDEDGYAELRFWHRLDAAPAEVTEVITGALAVLHATGGRGR
jgi:hypothetical protein